MSSLASTFSACRDSGRAALIAYLTGGHPTLEATAAALPAVVAAGADIVEVGVPFSDPIADGPVIAEAMHEALARGVTPSALLAAVGTLTTGDRPAVRAPVVPMVSVSIVHRLGAGRFVKDAAAAGCSGLIVPDLDVDADADLSRRCADVGLDLILLAAPTTAPARLERLATRSRGFVYVIARTGITGGQGGADLEALAARLARLRDMTDTPLAVGFGVSTPEHVAAIAGMADGVIVGTAPVRAMAAAGPAQAADAASELVRPLAGATGRHGGRAA